MHYRLSTLLLFVAALPTWAFLIVVVPQSAGFGGGLARFLTAPLVLTGIAAAIYWLLRNVPNRLAWAVFAAGVISLGSLTAVHAIQTFD